MFTHKVNVTIRTTLRTQRLSCYVDMDSQYPGMKNMWVLGCLDSERPFRVINPLDIVDISSMIELSKPISYRMSDILDRLDVSVPA